MPTRAAATNGNLQAKASISWSGVGQVWYWTLQPQGCVLDMVVGPNPHSSSCHDQKHGVQRMQKLENSCKIVHATVGTRYN